MQVQANAEQALSVMDFVDLDDLAVEVLIKEARQHQRRRYLVASSAATLAIAALAAFAMFVAAGAASPGQPSGQGSSAPVPWNAVATSVPTSCTAAPDSTPQGNMGEPPSGPALLNWVESTFAARYPTIWGGEAARQVTTANGSLINVATYRVTSHVDQLEREVRAIDPEATFILVPYSEACLRGVQAEIEAQLHTTPLSTWQVNGVGLDQTKVEVSAASCDRASSRELETWLHNRYGDRVRLSSCQANAHT
ncbi:MAG: hypothetical protein WCI12_02420 [Actinomycetes bacterium]